MLKLAYLTNAKHLNCSGHNLNDLNLYWSAGLLLVISFIVVTIAKNLCLPEVDMQDVIQKAISDDNYI